MKFLVVGDAGSIFIKQFIEFVLLDSNYEIVLIKEGFVCKDYLDFYNKNNVKVESICQGINKFIMKIPKLRAKLGAKVLVEKLIKKYGKFDIVHIHGVNYFRGNIGKFMRKFTNNLTITVWGDEIFRAKKNKLEYYKRYYDLADCITVSTEKMHKAFVRVYEERYINIMKRCYFAAGVLDYINKVKQLYTRKEICESFGISAHNKKLVFVGHNGRTAQRHFELTDQLRKLNKLYKDEILLVYTMTYGVLNQEYLKELEISAINTGCEYVILIEFLNEIEIAKLRSICDIMLHAQLTDALSASMVESLYAGAIILNGGWLKYDEVEILGECFVVYDKIEDINLKLEEVLTNFDKYKVNSLETKERIYNVFSVKKTTQQWKEVLHLNDRRA